jgi:hypothetical protein
MSGCGNTYRLAHSSEPSHEAARAIVTVVGPRAPIIDFYLAALSFAPVNHLALLARRGARIVFGPTVDAVLTSPWAAKRRGRELSMSEARQTRIDYGPESGTAGAYDSAIDALVFPTSYRAKDVMGVVLHELGHALTLPRAQLRAALIKELPSRLRRHVYSECYRAATQQETLRCRILEALAEGYVYLLEGRSDELPDALTSELIFILQSVEDGDRIRFEFETTPDGERTASRVSQRELIGGSDPEEGHLYSSMRLVCNAAAWDLVDDQLAQRRRRRSSAA